MELRSTVTLLISKLTYRYIRYDGSQGQCSSIAAMPFSGTLGRGQFGLRMLNDKKKIGKRKKKEWRREKGEGRMENEEWGMGAPSFSILQFVIRKLFPATN